MKAITHNVKYLAIINESNSVELKVTKERLVAISAFNERLQDENADYKRKNEILLEDQRLLAQKREEMAKMIIESQANSKEIEQLYEEQKSSAEQYEKLNVEITVLVTEKLTLKKERDKLENDLRKLRNEYKQQRVNYDLLMDEVSKTNKQNAEYRTLILDNEKKLGEVGQEISELQKHLERKNQQLNRASDETMVYKKQIEKLLEELKDKSDSESFDDEKEKLLNVKKAMESDQLKE